MLSLVYAHHYYDHRLLQTLSSPTTTIIILIIICTLKFIDYHHAQAIKILKIRTYMIYVIYDFFNNKLNKT